MSFGNHVSITGNLVRDPELKFLASGNAVANFDIAWNQKAAKDSGREDRAHFIPVTVWGQAAENVADSLTKGMRVTVVGRLDQQTWEDKETGGNRSKLGIVAEDVSPSLSWATAEVSKNEQSGARVRKPETAAPPQYEINEDPFRRDAADWSPGWWGAYPS